jgi:hypothetical protein
MKSLFSGGSGSSAAAVPFCWFSVRRRRWTANPTSTIPRPSRCAMASLHFRHRRRRLDVRRRLDLAQRSRASRRRSGPRRHPHRRSLLRGLCSTGGGLGGGHASTIHVMWTKSLDPKSPDFGFNDDSVVASSDGVEDCDAIDPAFLLDPTDGRLWLTYGTYFGFIRLVELDPKTGSASPATSPSTSPSTWKPPT